MPPHDSLSSHIILTSHPSQQIVHSTPIHWGAKTAKRNAGPSCHLTTPSKRNAIGTHGGIYSIYQALAASADAYPANSSRTSPTPPLPSASDPIQTGATQKRSSR